jgi:hypothetical protein
MDQNIDNEILSFFKTFVQVDRLKIAGLLGESPLTLEQTAQRLHLRMADAANHLSYLVHEGYVTAEGKQYRLNTGVLESLAKRTLAGLRPKVNPDELEGEAYDRKVLSDFLLADGKIKSLPMQQKKLLVILRHVLRSFSPGIEYPEKQVNEILRRYFEDTPSLRRYLVDSNMLKRDKGIYQVVTNQS